MELNAYVLVIILSSILLALIVRDRGWSLGRWYPPRS